MRKQVKLLFILLLVIVLLVTDFVVLKDYFQTETGFAIFKNPNNSQVNQKIAQGASFLFLFVGSSVALLFVFLFIMFRILEQD